jgi:hypothetical protein
MIYSQVLNPEVIKASPFEFIDKNGRKMFADRYIRAKVPNCASIIFELEIINEKPCLLLNDLKIDYSAEFSIAAPELLWSQ